MKKDNLKELKDNLDLFINLFPFIGFLATFLLLIFYFLVDKNRILNLIDNLYILSPFIRYTGLFTIYRLVIGRKNRRIK